MISRSYNLDKITMLNAAYDVLDALDICIEHVNSDRGTLVFNSCPQERVRMIFETKYPEKSTVISFISHSGGKAISDEGVRLADVILDEIDSNLRRVAIN